jgi:hypothetical protein
VQVLLITQRFFLIIVGSLFFPTMSYADIYKHTDKNGVVYFTDKQQLLDEKPYKSFRSDKQSKQTFNTHSNPVLTVTPKPKSSIFSSSVSKYFYNKFQIGVLYGKDVDSKLKGIRFLPTTKSDDKLLNAYLMLLKEEYQKYPSSFMKAIGLKQILLVKKLSYRGQLRAAIPDMYNEKLYFSIDSLSDRPRDVLYVRHIIHHEIYHMLEEQVYGTPYYQDPAWQKLNDPKFKYGAGGKYYRSRESLAKLAKTNPYQGFVSNYAMSGIEEDKAEVYGYLMTVQGRKILNNKQAKDPILRAKVKKLKADLYALDPNINQAFWTKLSP